jgi:hypothetical protein
MSPEEDKQLDKFIKENLKLGCIIRMDSPYASGFFFIIKDSKLRPVQDYRQLNKWMVLSQYPLLLIEDIVHKFAGKKWFTKFNVWWGYNNHPIVEEDQWKAAFKTKRGLFKPMVMFFGLCSSPATFQGFIDDTFKEEINSGDYGIYGDNILVATDGTFEHYIKHLHHILDKIKDNDLSLKPEKCTFYKKEIDYLGLIIGNGAVCMDPIKVEGITKWPIPTTVKLLLPRQAVKRSRCGCDPLWFCSPHDACFIHELCLCDGSGKWPPVKPVQSSWVSESREWLAAILSHQ